MGHHGYPKAFMKDIGITPETVIQNRMWKRKPIMKILPAAVSMGMHLPELPHGEPICWGVTDLHMALPEYGPTVIPQQEIHDGWAITVLSHGIWGLISLVPGK